MIYSMRGASVAAASLFLGIACAVGGESATAGTAGQAGTSSAPAAAQTTQPSATSLRELRPITETPAPASAVAGSAAATATPSAIAAGNAASTTTVNSAKPAAATTTPAAAAPAAKEIKEPVAGTAAATATPAGTTAATASTPAVAAPAPATGNAATSIAASSAAPAAAATIPAATAPAVKEPATGTAAATAAPTGVAAATTPVASQAAPAAEKTSGLMQAPEFEPAVDVTKSTSKPASGKPAISAAAQPSGETVTLPDVPPAILEQKKVKPERAAKFVTPPSASQGGKLRLNLQETVFMTLKRNASFTVDRLAPKIQETYERDARAAFDPVLSANISAERDRIDTDYHKLNTAGTTSNQANPTMGSAITQKLPTGTTLELGTSRTWDNVTSEASDTKSTANAMDAKVTQSLLRGAGLDVNLADLRQARIDTRISEYELRGAAETLVSDVETAYWDHVLAERSIAVYEKSLEIAQQQIRETRERVNTGNMAETELASAEAEVASRYEDLIDARATLAKAKLTLLRLLNPGGDAPWAQEIELSEPAEMPNYENLDSVENHVALGLRQRADLNEARLSIERGDIEVVRTKNGLLPKLDFFVSTGRTRYAKSFSSALDTEVKDRDISAGLTLEYALGNRTEKATHDRALFSVEKARASLVNMEQLSQVDIRSAYVEVERTQAQIKATAATRALREQSVRVEQEKFKVGKSTSVAVAETWRDLVSSKISEIEAVINYRKALIDLYVQEGSILERKGIHTGTGKPAGGPPDNSKGKSK